MFSIFVDVQCFIIFHPIFIAVHEKRKDHFCDMCGMKFSQKTGLDNHTKTVHLKIKDFKCKFCDYASGLKGSLDKHVSLVHEKRRDFKCESCGKM